MRESVRSDLRFAGCYAGYRRTTHNPWLCSAYAGMIPCWIGPIEISTVCSRRGGDLLSQLAATSAGR